MISKSLLTVGNIQNTVFSFPGSVDSYRSGTYYTGMRISLGDDGQIFD